MAADHTRAPATRAVAQIVTSQNSARPSAHTTKNTTTSSADGNPQWSCSHCHPAVTCAAPYMYIP